MKPSIVYCGLLFGNAVHWKYCIRFFQNLKCGLFLESVHPLETQLILLIRMVEPYFRCCTFGTAGPKIRHFTDPQFLRLLDEAHSHHAHFSVARLYRSCNSLHLLHKSFSPNAPTNLHMQIALKIFAIP